MKNVFPSISHSQILPGFENLVERLHSPAPLFKIYSFVIVFGYYVWFISILLEGDENFALLIYTLIYKLVRLCIKFNHSVLSWSDCECFKVFALKLYFLYINMYVLHVCQ